MGATLDSNAVNMAMLSSGMYGPNPYSPFQNQPIPWPSSYAGMPTDAMGNPIQAPGVTLNSTPAAAAPAPQTNPGQWDYNTAMLNAQGRNLAMGNRGGMSMGDIIDQRAMNNRIYGKTQPFGGPVLQPNMGYGGAPAAQPAAGGSADAGGQGTMGLPTALRLLANPGNPVTPGATVPQAPSQGMRPSVLSQFLNQNQGGAGAGNYNNQGFFNTLNALRNQ